MIHRIENLRLHVFLCVFHSSPTVGDVKEEWINDTLHARKFAVFGGPEYEHGPTSKTQTAPHVAQTVKSETTQIGPCEVTPVKNER